MSRFASLALVLLVLANGCSQPEQPLDPTSQALEYLHEHKYDDAIRSASEAIQQSPNNAAARLYRGRAYYYRAAMGDAHRAIEDLGEAIRLAPDSSDAYYVRALLYRELGETDLADKDDSRARELDHVARAVFDRLPDSPPPLDLSKLKPVDSGTKTEPPKTAAELLKDSEATASKTGADSTAKTPGTRADSFASGPGEEASAPVESAFNKQYRALLGQGTRGEESLPAETPVKDLFARPLDGGDTASAPAPTEGKAAPMPSGEDAKSKSTGGGAGTWTQMPARPLQSPFARQTPGAANPTTPGTTTPGMLPTIQSPFPQATRKATGYVPPVSPFGAPGGQASGATGVSRPFGTPGTTMRPQNDAVRPPFARDYLP